MEAYFVTIAQRKGKRVVKRHRLNVPAACASGHYEDLSDRALNDLRKDLLHEYRRRRGESLDQTHEDLESE